MLVEQSCVLCAISFTLAPLRILQIDEGKQVLGPKLKKKTFFLRHLRLG
jgi:hypothetical protein